MSKKMFGIDFGTSMFKIYRKDVGVVLDEKTVIAVAVHQNRLAMPVPNVNKKEVIAGGNKAFEMCGKAPSNIRVTYPVKNGVIAEIENMQFLFNYFINQLSQKKNREEDEGSYQGKITGADFLIAVPTDVTDVEKRAFYDIIYHSNAKPKKMFSVEKPIAAAMGIGLDITHARGVMTVDIGADTTELSIISLGGIVLSKLIPVGGKKMDESIKMFVKKNYNLLIGDKTAEIIKKELAAACNVEDHTIKVYGRNVVTGLPSEMEIGSSMVHESIKEHLRAIVDSIRIILERTPPEISSDIIKSGIYVTGGSAKIKNIARLISGETDLLVNINEDSEDSVVKGLGIIMNQNSYTSLATFVKQGG